MFIVFFAKLCIEAVVLYWSLEFACPVRIALTGQLGQIKQPLGEEIEPSSDQIQAPN